MKPPMPRHDLHDLAITGLDQGFMGQAAKIFTILCEAPDGDFEQAVKRAGKGMRKAAKAYDAARAAIDNYFTQPGD